MNINNITGAGGGDLTTSIRNIPEEYTQPEMAAAAVESEQAAGELEEQTTVSERIEEITEENLEEVEEAVELLEHAAAAIDYDLEFNILPSENVIQARLLEGESGDLIREIPPSEVIERRKRLLTFMGLMVDVHR